MESKRPLICVIDASSFIFRAFYAIRHLSTKKGLPTNATYGFATMIVKVLEDLSPTHLAIVYDTKHPSFRKEKYPEYKANRTEMPNELAQQIPYIKRLVEVLGLPRFEKNGLEADDIIAALAHHARKNKEDVCIVSSDKDLMQLVNEHTYMFDTMKNLKLGAKEVKEKMGVGPNLITDYLGLVGDSSDNIPGVKGIGPKSAIALLEEFGSLEGIYKNLEKIKAGKQKENLTAHRDNAFLSKELATVRTEVGIDFNWRDLACAPVFDTQVEDFLAEMEFHKLGDRLKKLAATHSNGHDASAPAAQIVPTSLAKTTASAGDRVARCGAKYSCVQSLAELEKIFQEALSVKEIAVDTETTGLGPAAEIVGFSFCYSEKAAWYVPLAHKDAAEQCDKDAALKQLKKFLSGKMLVGQNIKYDLNILRKYGLEFGDGDIAFDTMLASYVINPSERHNMDYLSQKYLSHDTITYTSLCGTGKNEITFAEVPLDRATEYAAEDAHVTWLLYQELNALLKENPKLQSVYNSIELPLITVLADMEWEGVEINKTRLADLSQEFARDMEKLVLEAHRLAGGEFNLASPKQLQEILFEKLKLPALKKTKTGFSTDVDVLSKLAPLHELPAVILRYREIAKLKSTYVDVLPQLADAEDRVHTSYNQTIAATGRLSSSDPNLQNIPIRTELGKKIRAAFVARRGHLLLGADYSQIELRILAFLSGDKILRQAFQAGKDIHTITASKVFGVELEEVSPDLRRKAKAINFGLLYGKTAFSLAEELGIARKEATEIIDNYFHEYPTIKKFLLGLADRARERGFAETMYGRRRPIEGINDRNKMVRAMAERMAINTPIQGTAADIMKIAMNRLHAELLRQKFATKIILQVHDELVLEVPQAEVERVKPVVRECMENAGDVPGFTKIDVPLTVEIGTGKDWLSLS